MLAIHALLTPIPLRRITIPKLTPFILSQSESSSGSFSGLITFYRRRRSYRVITSMAAGSGSISTEHVTEKWFSVPELRLRNHRFSVPLDYSKPSPKITVFAREIVAVGKEEQALPYLLYLQGGPGFEGPRPSESGGWIQRACEEFRVILLDQVYPTHFIYSLNTPFFLVPEDVEIVRELVTYLAESEGGGVPLPSGGILTPHGLQTLGLSGLGSSTGFERLHYMLERVWDPILVPGSPKRISQFFLNAFETWHSFDTNPLYALLHEAIYCEGASSRWSAHRLREKFEHKFDAVRAVKEGQNVLFTGEMIFPWMFDEIHALKPFKAAADILAKKEDWPPLYDAATLKTNKVPVAAAVYYEDMYVNFKLVMETASQISGVRLWVTNEYMHSGLRDSGRQVLDHLFGMINGKKPLF